MAFRESSPVEERIALFNAYESGAFTVVDLCERYDISRETFYVWKRRRDAGDARWFDEKSRTPGHCPHATPSETVAAILALRQRFPRFGPKKIRARLALDQPGLILPAASTIGDILKREGLIEKRPRRRRSIAQGEIVAGSDVPNGEWAIDFKGWFRTRDGERVDPLTVSDTASRYLVAARITPPTHDGVKAAMERVFNEVGLPDAIRSDNGAPFGSIGAGGLSRLSVWFLKLGIEPRYIPPASPQDNGRHERMHRTMKDETARPPARFRHEQQYRFNVFRRLYNEERPHEALDQVTPASLWTPSKRTMPRTLDEPWYDADHQVRRVRPDGTIKWRGEHVFIGEALVREPVGLAEQERGGYIVRFCGRDLGMIDFAGRFHRFAPPRARLRSAPKPAIDEQ
ncbi:MAG: transposase [Hyphomicrobiaceae bacterium]|nr:transposase [Hyphomicrobiaceae bacterium]MCC0009155.1 transposase [Hyphomicrobiaceae bacterium]MCC0009206.1 transposase [Hyphomicrobiaceae bacterium]MCC0009779.1 transposase [Hyphomicrobiaceae bacterium]MCC0010188.1 transposase [Hyphomicrobiaceae bacterium]